MNVCSLFLRRGGSRFPSSGKYHAGIGVTLFICMHTYIHMYIHTFNIDTQMLCVFGAVQFLVCTNDAKMFLCQ